MNFPRRGGIQIGGTPNFNSPAYQAALAGQDVMVLEWYPGLAPGGVPMDTCIKAIKAINPAAQVFLYTSSDGEKLTQTPKAFASFVAMLQLRRWWLNDANGAPVPSFFTGEDTVNNTCLTAPDEIGNTSMDWITRYLACNAAAVPSADGLYMDNVFAAPRVAGDWCADGVVLQPNDPKAITAIQGGYQRWFSLSRQLMPGKKFIGNIQSWTANGATVPAAYVNMTDGGVLEKLIGVVKQSVEDWGGWAKMMAQYWKTMAVVNEPKLVIFGQYGDPTDYQSARYGLTSCLMHNAYHSFTDEAVGYSGVVHFDEYDANLGAPIWEPPTSAWSQGTWRRDFQNGTAIVNPKGNGPQTLQLETPYVKMQGAQCPEVNNGAMVTSVTLQDRDGIILLRPEQPSPALIEVA